MPRVALAHSSPDQTQPAQTYYDHLLGTTGVVPVSTQHAIRASQLHPILKEMFPYIVNAAAEFHDLGKLNEGNQCILRGEKKARHLKDHVDAGTATLIEQNWICSAILVFSHHRGLPAFSEECALEKGAFRSRNKDNSPNYEWSDNERGELLALHNSLIDNKIDLTNKRYDQITPLGKRIALSCLVDADHSDTALFYNSYSRTEWPLLQAEERLQALDKYVQELYLKGDKNDRNELRRIFYEDTRHKDAFKNGIVSCDAPVGSGKTTAVIAHLLHVAKLSGRDKIIIVLPYTSIIDQTVDVLRAAITLPGEDPHLVVTAHHHRTEFQDHNLRAAAINWNGPIIVTTAVQFFETISGSSTGVLRKLHRITNACIMIDEAHNCIPVHLWKQHLDWFSELSSHWNVYFVLASGSLCEFWKIKDLSSKKLDVPPLLSPTVSSRLQNLDKSRYRKILNKEVSVAELVQLITEKKGPRIVVLNTVRGAATVALALLKLSGSEKVLHLSTALAPKDRTPIINIVKERLKNKNDTDWTLVATTCVEAGMDFSFATGFRERASLLSYIQLGGRVNRSLDWDEAELIDFVVTDLDWTKHPDFTDLIEVFNQLIKEDIVENGQSTESIIRFLRYNSIKEKVEKITKNEKKQDFPEVQKCCRVINSETLTVIVDEELAQRVRERRPYSWKEIQNSSVQLFVNGKLRAKNDFRIESINESDELFAWKLSYDPNFLGYMDGIMKIEDIKKASTLIF